MKRAPVLLLMMLLVTGAQPALAEPPTGKVKVTQASDLPTRTYAIQGKPSELVQNHAALLSLVQQVEKDAKDDLERFDIQDPASLQSLYTTLYVAGLLRRDYAAAGKNLEQVRGLASNPLARQVTGLFTEPLIQSSQMSGDDIRALYRAKLSKRLQALPFQEMEGYLANIRKAQKAGTREAALGRLADAADTQVKDGRIGEEAVGAILATAQTLYVTLPLKDDVLACLDALFEAHKADAASRPRKLPILTAQIQAKGALFGQPLPGMTPVPFAPEILKAVSPHVHGIAFSPDGTECFLNVGDAYYSGSTLYVTRCVNGSWTPLEEPAFSADFQLAGEPLYLDGGKTLQFTARKSSVSTDFWTVSRSGQGWGAATPLPSPLNTTAGNEFRGNYTADGTFYFGTDASTPGSNQVHRAVKTASGAWAVEKLGAPINVSPFDGDPCIAPDGRFLVYYSAQKPGLGRVDLFVSFADGKGGWGQPINLGPSFNSAGDDFGACLSPDGKYLFFLRHSEQSAQIYWVSVAAIDRLKP